MPAMRYLANAVIHRDRVYRNHIVESLTDGRVDLRPFAGEEHSTTFFSGIILVVRRDAVDETVSRMLTAMTRRAALLELAIHRVRRYASGHDLYASGVGDDPVLLLLPRR